jgi:hypothetical protein
MRRMLCSLEELQLEREAEIAVDDVGTGMGTGMFKRMQWMKMQGLQESSLQQSKARDRAFTVAPMTTT